MKPTHEEATTSSNSEKMAGSQPDAASKTGAEVLMAHFRSRCESPGRIRIALAEIAIHSLCDAKESTDGSTPDIVRYHSQEILAL
jgi:hypothetical protein